MVDYNPNVGWYCAGAVVPSTSFHHGQAVAGNGASSNIDVVMVGKQNSSFWSRPYSE